MGAITTYRHGPEHVRCAGAGVPALHITASARRVVLVVVVVFLSLLLVVSVVRAAGVVGWVAVGPTHR